MNTLGWVFILVGVLVIRAVSKGRVLNIGEDLSDAFLAIANGDSKELTEVLQRTGDSSESSSLKDYRPIVKTAAGIENTGTSLAKKAIALGEKAQGYRWEATGPDYYDCSGLIWRACKAIGYPGGRFTTATVRSNKKYFSVIEAPGTSGPGVISAGYDDLVLWPAGSGGITGHIGVITGADTFYSARSVRSGIGNAKISTFRKTKPIYLRYVGKRTETDPF